MRDFSIYTKMYTSIIASFYHVEKYDYTNQSQITNRKKSFQV